MDFIKIKNFWASRDAIVKILPREWEKIFADCMSDINNTRCADDTTLMAESEKELKSLLMKVKEESEKASFRGRWEGGSGWGTHVNPWLIHFNV